MKIKATDALLADHRLIRKIMESFMVDNPRFAKICQTLHRALQGHAWFEDTIFLPAVQAEPLFFQRFTQEIIQEHNDMDLLMKLLRKTPATNMKELAVYSVQMRAILETHFRKEEDALFPLAEKILTEEGLIHLGEEMKERQTEVRQFLDS